MNARTLLLVVLAVVVVLLALPSLTMGGMMASMMGLGVVGWGMMGGGWWLVPLFGPLVLVGLVVLVVWAVGQGGGPGSAAGDARSRTR
jgi:uncharacterized membrane protein